MGTEEQQVQRDRGYRGTVVQWLQRDSGNMDWRGTVRIEEQWLHRNSQYRGTMGTEEQWYSK